MPYNPDRQYRCTIIRGRTKNEMDNLLPAYVNILREICPCSTADFPENFQKKLAQVLKISTVKTLANHRTETAGKLFGMFYEDNGVIKISERVWKFLINQDEPDQPAFFKDICYKFQFPNGMDKISKIKQDIDNGIKIRQCAYVLALLTIAEKAGKYITMSEIGYYVLNSLDVLQGKTPPQEVFELVIDNRRNGIEKKLVPGSRTTQHIRETINYLILANLVRNTDDVLTLNEKERNTIEFISKDWNKLFFNMYSYDLSDPVQCKQMYSDWQKHYTSIFPKDTAFIFRTALAALAPESSDEGGRGIGQANIALGDDGEAYVYKIEKERVKLFNPRLANRVLHLGKTKGLGYDVQSVKAQAGTASDHSIYIEVKTTKRVTAPNLQSGWADTVTLTRTEWLAAEQHRQSYFIYRVYFTQSGVVVFVIHDPATQDDLGNLSAEAMIYRVDFTAKAGEFLDKLHD